MPLEGPGNIVLSAEDLYMPAKYTPAEAEAKHHPAQQRPFVKEVESTHPDSKVYTDNHNQRKPSDNHRRSRLNCACTTSPSLSYKPLLGGLMAQLLYNKRESDPPHRPPYSHSCIMKCLPRTLLQTGSIGQSTESKAILGALRCWGAGG